jgi:hypothetical protein
LVGINRLSKLATQNIRCAQSRGKGSCFSSPKFARAQD